MPNVKAILEHLRAQRAELDTTIRVLETLDNGASAATTDRAARRALAAVTGNGHEPEPRVKRKYTRRAVPLSRPPSKARPDLVVPKDLTLAGMDIADAIRTALQAAGEPLSTADLVALLAAGGFRLPRQLNQPPTRFIGMHAARALGKRARGDDGRWRI